MNLHRIAPVEKATYKQREAIANLRTVLGRSLIGARDLSKRMASKEIKEMLEIIKRNGFPKRENEMDVDWAAEVGCDDGINVWGL